MSVHSVFWQTCLCILAIITFVSILYQIMSCGLDWCAFVGVQTRSALETRQDLTCSAASLRRPSTQRQTKPFNASLVNSRRPAARWPARRNVSTPHMGGAGRSWAEAAEAVRQVYSKIWGRTLHLTQRQIKPRPFYPRRVIKEAAMLPMNINTPAVLLWNGPVFCFIAGVWIQESVHRLLVCVFVSAAVVPQYRLF